MASLTPTTAHKAVVCVWRGKHVKRSSQTIGEQHSMIPVIPDTRIIFHAPAHTLA